MFVNIPARIQATDRRIARLSAAIIESHSIPFIRRAARLVERAHAIRDGLVTRAQIESVRHTLLHPDGAVMRLVSRNEALARAGR